MSDIAELLERFRRGPETVASALSAIDEAALDYQPAPGKWSVRQIMAHLADSEMDAGLRFRRILAEENPTIYAYNQDAWAEKLDYARRDTSRSLEVFRLVRNGNYELLAGLSPESFDRKATHSVRGSMPLRDWLEIYARHAEKHAGQMQRAFEAYQTRVKE